MLVYGGGEAYEKGKKNGLKQSRSSRQETTFLGKGTFKITKQVTYEDEGQRYCKKPFGCVLNTA